MTRKSVLSEAKEIQLAIDLIRLGARLQLLEAETSLSRERLLKLYKELKGVSPPKGMLPFSADWFITWRPNIHASLFTNIYKYLRQYSDVSRIEAVIKAYQLYLEQIKCACNEEPVLSLTRAWTLVRFLDNRSPSDEVLHAVRRELRRSLPRPERRLCLWSVSHAIARGQDQEGQANAFMP